MVISQWLFRCTLTLALLQFASVASAEPLEIKGLSIGMSRADIQQTFPSFIGFTIAGVPSIYLDNPVHAYYFEDKLDNLNFYFAASSFTTVLSAVKEKYPKLSCKESQVGNAMGAKFNQVECSLSDELSILSLDRYASDLNTSVLTLISKRKLRDLVDKAKKTNKDI